MSKEKQEISKMMNKEYECAFCRKLYQGITRVSSVYRIATDVHEVGFVIYTDSFS